VRHGLTNFFVVVRCVTSLLYGVARPGFAAARGEAGLSQRPTFPSAPTSDAHSSLSDTSIVPESSGGGSRLGQTWWGWGRGASGSIGTAAGGRGRRDDRWARKFHLYWFGAAGRDQISRRDDRGTKTRDAGRRGLPKRGPRRRLSERPTWLTVSSFPVCPRATFLPKFLPQILRSLCTVRTNRGGDFHAGPA